MRYFRTLAAACLIWGLVMGGQGTARAQTKPEGEMRWAIYLTLSPAWFDPGDSPGLFTPFWFLYAMHDALAKPMPGQHMAPSLAESWTVSADNLVYEFKLRPNVKFHNGDPFTAEDAKFSFLRAKVSIMHKKVKEVIVVDPLRLRFVLHEPWPDFLTFYGTLVTASGWVVPKAYMEKAGVDGFKRNPVGLGPYKFVSHTPGVELILEANEDYWRKVPSVKRMVFKIVPDATTRAAMLMRGEVDVAHLLDGTLAQAVKNDPKLRLVFGGGVGTSFIDFLDMWDPKSPWADPRVRLAASLAIDRKAISEVETMGASPPTGNVVPPGFEYALRIPADPYDPARAKQLLAEAGYPNGFDAGDLNPWPPYFSTGEAVVNFLGAVGIRTRMRTMERAAFYNALAAKKLKGLCVCMHQGHGNAASRLSETAPSDGVLSYGGFPDMDDLFRRQAVETDVEKRRAMLNEIQQTLHDRHRYAPIYDYMWASGVGPRVEEPAVMLIDPYPWPAPYEEVRLKRP